MKNNTTNQVEIPLKLKAAPGAANELDAARLRILKTAYLIKSLFKLIGISQLASSELCLDEQSTDDLLQDVQHASELGIALASSLNQIEPVILAAARNLEEQKHEETKGQKSKGRKAQGGLKVVQNR